MAELSSGNLAPLFSLLKDAANASSATAFLLRPLAMLEDTVVASGRRRFEGFAAGLSRRVAAAREAPLEDAVLVLATCLVAAALLHRIAAVVRWAVLGRLPTLLLIAIVLASTLCSAFLGSFGLHALLLVALMVSGGCCGDEGSDDAAAEEAAAWARSSGSSRSPLRYLAASSAGGGSGGRFGRSRSQSLRSVLNNDGLVVVRCGRRGLWGAVGRALAPFAPSRVAAHCLVAMGVVQLFIFTAPTQALVVTMLDGAGGAASNGAVSFSSSSPPLAEAPTALLATSHANGRWAVGREREGGALLLRAAELPLYRHVVSYFAGSDVTGARPQLYFAERLAAGNATEVGGGDGAVLAFPLADADAVWLFGSGSRLSNIVVGCTAAAASADGGKSIPTQATEACAGGNVKRCTYSADSTNDLLLEPILVAKADAVLSNVVVECAAFAATNSGRSNGSPCLLLEEGGASVEAAYSSGLTILVHGRVVTFDAAVASGLVRLAPFEPSRLSSLDLSKSGEEGSDEERVDEERAVFAHASYARMYKCLVKRHEPHWHVLVRSWPATALLLTRGASAAAAGLDEAWRVAVWPSLKAIGFAASESAALGAAGLCGAIEGARFTTTFDFCMPSAPPSPLSAAFVNNADDSILSPVDAASETTPAFLYSSQSLTAAILSPTADYAAVRAAFLQFIYETSAASVGVAMWSGLPWLWNAAAAVVELEWRMSVVAFEWSLLPFIRAFAYAACAVYDVAASEAVVGTLSSAASTIGSGSWAAVSGASLWLWGIASEELGPFIWRSGLWLFRGATVATSIYAETSFNVQLLLALLQTFIVAYNLHLQVIGYNPTAGSPAGPVAPTAASTAPAAVGVSGFASGLLTRARGGLFRAAGAVANAATGGASNPSGPRSSGGGWSRSYQLTQYFFGWSRICARNYKSCVVYGVLHGVAALLVLGTTFLPFSGALGLHFLTLNVAFPALSSYALLHFIDATEGNTAMAVAMLCRVLLAVALQQGLGGIVSSLYAELVRLLLLTLAVGVGALLMPHHALILSILTRIGGWMVGAVTAAATTAVAAAAAAPSPPADSGARAVDGATSTSSEAAAPPLPSPQSPQPLSRNPPEGGSAASSAAVKDEAAPTASSQPQEPQATREPLPELLNAAAIAAAESSPVADSDSPPNTSPDVTPSGSFAAAANP